MPGKTRATKRTVKAKVSDQRGCPRLRISLRDGLILGPGKVELLEAIEQEGSISGAARTMGMSYRRAWLLVDALNRMFDAPAVITSPGGAHGGGAEITELGKDVAAAYRRIEERANVAIREELGPLSKDID